MKKSLLQIGLAVIVSAVFCMSLSSCSSEAEPTTHNDLLLLEENVDALSSGYASLYEDLFKTIQQEYKQISASNIDTNTYFENFAELYISQLTPEEHDLLNRSSNLYGTRSADEPNQILLIPDEFLNRIKPILVDEDVNLLTEEIDQFYKSSYFLSLNNEEQYELKIQLESLKKIRNATIEIVIDYFTNEGETTRMSPGDRMIWSGLVNQMTDKQRKQFIDVNITGMGLVSNGLAATTLGLASLISTFLG